jgi:hypothetical protein
MNPHSNTQRTNRPSHHFATPVVREEPRPVPNGVGNSAW